jgi:ribosome-associated toxin RatA of RatAB toxin-antitoxin module
MTVYIDHFVSIQVNCSFHPSQNTRCTVNLNIYYEFGKEVFC